ncbi:MAG: hypothetical protein A2583_10365 [Bdellovibrionales bacterium RIFOXYD1_FULL_53_11]|nr:MAG: hypothetical protein A2583_10365 [Bdellovibrionales bacterium RIFOXYD1_FULL_53_11]
MISISLPPDMNDEIQTIAKEERRSISEIFREAIRQYATSRALADVRKGIKKGMKKKGIRASDIDAIVSAGRK